MEGIMEIILVALLVVFIGSGYSAPIERNQIAYFEGDEHEILGNRITLPREPLIPNPLTLPNGIQLTFGHIVALAGDFYGVPDKPIITPGGKPGEGLEEIKLRFLASYGTLATVPRTGVEKEVETLVRYLNEDKVVRETGEGKFHSELEYTRHTNGRMLTLAAKNFDHFQPQAKLAYLVGHQLAIEKARLGRKETNAQKKNKLLMEAYSLDAFACHFLTDCFSSGHIRTPRVELHNMVGGGTDKVCVGDALSKFMHDEDCAFGLNVKNENGEKWTAYGDKMLRRNGNSENLNRALAAVQRSVDQVNEAYRFPNNVIDPGVVTKLLPMVDPDAKNNAPLFQMRDGKLLRRKDVNNLQDRNTVDNWWGTTSCALLLSAKKQGTSALPNP